jgi:type I thyroxine 5'-deiodinase
VQFYVVYIREAHPLDGRSPMGGGDSPIVEEPVTLEERNAVATVCMTKLALEPMPALVDGIDNAVATAYAAAPDRLYLIGRDGNVAYRGGPGPFGFHPDELEAAIREELGLSEHADEGP